MGLEGTVEAAEVDGAVVEVAILLDLVVGRGCGLVTLVFDWEGLKTRLQKSTA